MSRAGERARGTAGRGSAARVALVGKTLACGKARECGRAVQLQHVAQPLAQPVYGLDADAPHLRNLARTIAKRQPTQQLPLTLRQVRNSDGPGALFRHGKSARGCAAVRAKVTPRRHFPQRRQQITETLLLEQVPEGTRAPDLCS